MRAALSAARIRRVAWSRRARACGYPLGRRLDRSVPPSRPPRARCSPRPRPRCLPRRRAAGGSRRGPSIGRRRRGRGSSSLVGAEREAGAEDEAAPVRAPGAHLAAVDFYALADADEPVAETVARRAALAVVAYLDLQLVGLIADGHFSIAGARVLEGVGQAFLDNSEGGEVDPPGERDCLAVDMQPDRQAGASELLQQ